ncbi:MAG: fibrillarin-like rRNA/tRNA 2'-O-methyltransferase [Candidatus Micrarchaeota archaeon]|nr:fibrillarin-like rRNA/tRNA 2'-O-methyltransferase [Candidatus Micrarchaeota archaeon]
MTAKRLFDGVFSIDGKLATVNLAKGKKVYGEELVEVGGREYRMWNPYRSKLAAAIMMGLKSMAMKEGDSVLYLGASTGTTSSHVSDIVGEKGIVYCVEISERSMRDLLKVCESRRNMLPIFGDARNVDEYADDVKKVDAIYEDVAAPDQADILIRNGALLKKNGFAYIAIKSQSIDVSKRPREVFDEFLERTSGSFSVVQSVDIDRYDKKHLFVVLKKS